MNSGVAKDIREHLISELKRNGFGDIANEVVTSFEEDLDEGLEKQVNKRNESYVLRYFLTETISILENISNDNFDDRLNKFNEYLNGDNKLDGMKVQILNQDDQYDLRNLPSYKEIINEFKSILKQLSYE